MAFSRWKLMAGVLSVSLGGLATVAGQCPKKDDTKGSKNPLEVSADSPAIPPVPMVKAPASGPAVPPPPADVKIPDSMPMIPSSQAPSPPPSTGIIVPTVGASQVGQLPALPAPQPIVPPAVQMPPMSTKASGAPQVIVPAGVITTPQLTPPAPDKEPQPVAPQAPDTKLTRPTVPSDVFPPVTQPVTPPSGSYGASGITTPSNPGSYGTSSSPTPPAPVEPPSFTPPKADPSFTPPKADPLVSSTTATKFRIVLRVGEGEPTFEVRSGDDLVLKVVCEKVDIKSPEKGTGLSSVKASGKVHFAGFGAEGTCDELSFLAGSGEVSMSGSVKIQVKDKLGRVESELWSETLKYKIGGSAILGTLKP